jgi:Glycosyltransferase family 87
MRRAAALAAAVLALVVAASAHADDLTRPRSLTEPPKGFRLTGDRVQGIAARDPKVVVVRRAHRGAYANVFLKGRGRWQVSYFSAGPRPRELAQVYVDDATARVTESWTGPQVAWTMARGYPGAFGRSANAPWVWIPLTLLFLVPFIDPRHPWRMRHLDAVVLAAFGVSLAFFNSANLDVSVPLVYPLLAYLGARMLWIGLRRDRAVAPWRPVVGTRWLAIGLVFLVGFRVGLNVTDSNVIDVGYAGVIGADRLADGKDVWGTFPSDNEHGDTYGPVAYAAYVPFEQVLPWSGSWDDLPAAHAAAVAFDLLCLALLFLIGRRIRGPSLGITLAYAWAAYPFTLLALECNSNDALVGALVLAAILAATAPAARGALIALAGMAKFAPLALAPLFATHTRGGAARFAAGLAAVLALSVALVLGFGGLSTFADRTLGYQFSRDSPFSIWGLYGWDAARTAVTAAAVGLAVVVAFVPRRRDVVGLSALSAAVLVALQLGVSHWFYLYLVWLAGPALVVLLADHGTSTGSIEEARSGSEESSMTTPLSQGSSSLVSNRTDMWVRMDSIACSLRTPMTPPRGPVMPTSVT